LALTDPQTITVNAVAKTMPKIPGGAGTASLYQLADMTFSLQIKHTSFKQDKKSRIKSLVTFSQRAVVADPLTAVNDYETVAISLQIDRPEVGFTSTQIDQMIAGFKTWLDTTMVGKLYGRES
jgi:hypothetical protein